MATIQTATWRGYDGSSYWNFRGVTSYSAPTETETTWSMKIGATYMQKTSGGECYGTGGWICGVAARTSANNVVNQSKKYVAVPTATTLGKVTNTTSSKLYFKSSDTNYKVGDGGTISIPKTSSRQTVYLHTFAGRNTSGGDGVYNGSVQTYNSVSYVIKAYSRTLTFNANGGSNPPSPITYEVGQAFSIPSTKPTAKDDFIGWNTMADGSGTWYYIGDSITLSDNLTLYAQYHAPYVAPKISNLVAYRTESRTSTAVANEGKVGYCEFDVTYPQHILDGSTVDVNVKFIRSNGATCNVPSTITGSKKVTAHTPTDWLDTALSATVEVTVSATPYNAASPSSVSDGTYISASIFVWDAFQHETIASFCVGGIASEDKSVFDAVMPLGDNFKAMLVDLFLPVGRIVQYAADIDPNTLYPNTTWEQIEGRFLLASNESADAYKLGATGGSTTMEHTHSLSSGHAQIHHNSGAIHGREVSATSYTGNLSITVTGKSVSESGQTNGIGLGGNTGGASATSIMPPFVSVKTWKRTE